ncbi:MAG: hypothetical protein ACE5Q6_10560 [Dehalococcoidia bacterium]
MSFVKPSKLFWLSVVALPFLLALVACGGAAPEGVAQNQQPPSDSAEGVSTSGQPASQTEGASGSRIAATTPCEAFSLMGGGLPGTFSMQAMGGPSIESSGSPQSFFAENVADFVSESLAEVLGGSVSADCFMEASMEQEAGVWIALSLPGGLPEGAAQSIGDNMAENGATVSGAFNSASMGGTFDMVAFEKLPFDSPNGGAIQGGLFFLATEEGNNLAIAVATYTAAGDSLSAAGSEITAGEYAGEAQVDSVPVPAEAPVAVAPTGFAAEINEELQPVLEEALGVTLILESFFQTETASGATVTLAYFIDGESPSGSDPLPGLTEAVEALGGKVSFSFSSGDAANVTYEGLNLGGLATTGSFTVGDNRISVILTSVNK